MKVNFKPEPQVGGNGDAAIEIPRPTLNGTTNGGFAPRESDRTHKPFNRPPQRPSSRRNWFKSAYAVIDSSFRIKVLLPVVACLAVAVAATFYVMDRRLARQFDTDARRTLLAANEVVRNSQQFHRNDLLLRFHNLPQVPLWNDVFQSGAPKDLHDTLLALMGMQKVDIVFYASKKGKILDVVNNVSVPHAEFESAASTALLLALDGNEKSDTVRVAGRLYDVFAIPAYDPSNKQIGAMVLGSEIGAAEAEALSKMTRCAVALMSDGRIIASTLPALGASVPFAAAFGKTLPPDDKPGRNVKPLALDGQQYYAVSGRFESLAGDTSLGYVLLSSRAQELAEMAAAQHVVVGVGLLAILVGGLAVYFFIYKATVPLRELRQGAQAVEHGEFSRRVPVRSRDECGQLALVFNQMMESIEESRSRLEKNVEQLKSTQEQLQEQLVFSERLSAIGEFVAGVAHELNNPLAAVVGFSELLKNSPNDENRTRHYDIIFKSALRCKKIVQSLLSFARRDKPKREPASVNGIVESVLDLIGYALRTSNIEVKTCLESNLPPVLADANQIQQVLLNILTNAQQAMEGRQMRGQIKITTEFRKPGVRITIEDNGPGIPPENMSRLFDPFFTTKEVGKGTGLGLSLCYGFIKEHGGSIIPVSQLGKGAAFIIELPASENGTVAAQSDTSDTTKSNPRRGVGKRVLVIDDEEALLALIQTALSADGYEVAATSDGEKALADLKSSHFDLIICDWKMPGMNGRQIYEQLRAADHKNCRRMIFISGDVVNAEMRRFLEAEKRPCLAKPFTLPEFRAAIEDVLV
ncbi:MAG TPA: ATP-binding protein [Verrucomicrobiae bacterium]|jgi:signal transduction histidine kinase|nr:ATP-binding protein [Verrucomicrobiae bacterium]